MKQTKSISFLKEVLKIGIPIWMLFGAISCTPSRVEVDEEGVVSDLDITCTLMPESNAVCQARPKAPLRITWKELTFNRFPSGSADIPLKVHQSLKKIVGQLKTSGLSDGVWIEIAGHTDSDGDEDDNLKLSKKRAEVVRDYLIDALEGTSFPTERLVAKGYGETDSLYPNDTKSGKQKNRRVELKKVNGHPR